MLLRILIQVTLKSYPLLLPDLLLLLLMPHLEVAIVTYELIL